MSRVGKMRYWRRMHKLRHKNRGRRKHYQGRNYHHLFCAKHFGGQGTDDNMLLIKIERHEAFNRLFGPTCGVERAIQILQRVARAKARLALLN
jgi:hypothetical protein